MTRRDKGILGETKVLLEFINQGYEIFLPYSAGTPFDMIVYKYNKLYRVSVKFTSQIKKNSWIVTLKNVSRRNNSQLNIKQFDNTESDILAVYIQPEDRVVLFESKDIKAKFEISIKKY